MWKWENIFGEKLNYNIAMKYNFVVFCNKLMYIVLKELYMQIIKVLKISLTIHVFTKHSTFKIKVVASLFSFAILFYQSG